MKHDNRGANFEEGKNNCRSRKYRSIFFCSFGCSSEKECSHHTLFYSTLEQLSDNNTEHYFSRIKKNKYEQNKIMNRNRNIYFDEKGKILFKNKWVKNND
jgi:hypothetical protein